MTKTAKTKKKTKPAKTKPAKVEANSEVELKDIFPDKSEFTLRSTGKTYQLNLFSLKDRQWLQDLYPGEALNKVFNIKNSDFLGIMRIVYHQLADKTDFMAENVERVDDDGVLKKYLLTGPVKLFEAVGGVEELTQMLAAITKTVTDSEPAIKAYVESEVKKNIAEANAALRGQKSSTPSKGSMVGQMNTS